MELHMTNQMELKNLQRMKTINPTKSKIKTREIITIKS